MHKIEELAVPKKDFKKESHINIPKIISKFALQATASKRTIKLAEPSIKAKAQDDVKDSTKISKNALKAKATKRTIELSKPSKSRERIIKDSKGKKLNLKL